MLCNTFLQNTVVLLLLVSPCISWVVLLVLAGTTHAFIVSCGSVLLILAGLSHVWRLTGWSVMDLARMNGLSSMCFSIFSTRRTQTCSHASGWFKRVSKSVWALLRPGLRSGTVTPTHSIGQSKSGHSRYKALPPDGRGCKVALQKKGHGWRKDREAGPSLQSVYHRLHATCSVLQLPSSSEFLSWGKCDAQDWSSPIIICLPSPWSHSVWRYV